MTRGLPSILPLMALIAAVASGQPADGDYVVSETYTAGVHGVYVVNRTTGATSTLFTAPAGYPLPNWITMARNNVDLLVGFYLPYTMPGPIPGGLTRITPAGAAASYSTDWAIHNIRLLDDNRLLHNPTDLAGGPPIRSVVIATNDTAGGLTSLVAGFPGAGTSVTVYGGAENEDTGLWAFAGASDAAGLGYLAEANIQSGAITRTITVGMTAAVAADYNRHDGNYYVTEFGLPGDPYASGGTVWRITNDGVLTSIATGHAIDRVNCVDVAQNGLLIIGSRHNVLEMTTGGTILRTLPYQVDRSHAATGVTIYGENRLQLDTSAYTGPGSAIGARLSFRNPAAGGAGYVLAAALAERPGITMPRGEILDLAPDLLTIEILRGTFSTIFLNFVGTLDAAGNNVPPISVAVPGWFPPGTVRLFIAGVAYNGGGIVNVTETEAVTL